MSSTQTWADGPMVAFDLETTGPDPETALIVTASLVYVEPGQPPRTDDYLVDPGVEIPAGATAVHGITTEHARTHGERPADVVGLLSGALADANANGAPIVIYNAPYDLTVLERECVRHGQYTLSEHCDESRLPLYVVDPLVLDKAVDRYRPGSRKLVDVARHYGVPLSEKDAHTSSADAITAARIAWKIAHQYPIGGSAPDVLMDYQVMQYARQAASFEDYLRRQGKLTEPISRDWPIRAAVRV
ncbi:exonuclease domain-containing protein [Actinokineospora globicatena]|uniref:3'-5' exonuclease n=1 Tax=Actinokineospora globicatena TaxID=103729 RepID=A0A9W6VAB8_9PSEU|nr:exonuclease domain-containing protein [Actinokineospora globicatena]GLW91818.1 3'-5' exonuclease [Actinokineospora globicatena]